MRFFKERCLCCLSKCCRGSVASSYAEAVLLCDELSERNKRAEDLQQDRYALEENERDEYQRDQENIRLEEDRMEMERREEDERNMEERDYY